MTHLPLYGVAVVIPRHDRDRHADEHLAQLHERDDDGVEPARELLDCHEEVVSVHDRVHGVIHHDEEYARGGGRAGSKIAWFGMVWGSEVGMTLSSWSNWSSLLRSLLVLIM